MENKLTAGGELSQRKKLILRSVIESHISTGEPVGSKYLVAKTDIPYSSATIRNEMAELEELGYLVQPHTSAGRVPTSLGYRFYVDALMEGYSLTATEIVSLNNLLKSKMGELDSILRSASKLIAAMTNYTTVAVKAPRGAGLTVSRFSYMLLEPTAFLIVMQMSDGNVTTRHIRTEIPVDDEMLSRLVAVLNEGFCDRHSDEITLPMMMNAETAMGAAGALVSPVVKAIYDTIDKGDETDINFEGINKLLEYPEFSDVTEMKKIIRMFEDKDELMKLIVNADDSKVNIYIGKDGELPGNAAFVFKTIKIGGKTAGVIGVFGPSRMDYSKVISTVEYLSRNLSGESAAGLIGAASDDEEKKGS